MGRFEVVDALNPEGILVKRLTDTCTGNSCLCIPTKIKTIVRAAKDCVACGEYNNTRYTAYAQGRVEQLFTWPTLYEDLLKVHKFYSDKDVIAAKDRRTISLLTMSHVIKLK